jgi:O-acetylserine/cysteine efflux transporter
MKPAHIGLGVLVAVVWGGAFVATRIGLDSFSPAQLTTLRFLIAALPALALPRPAIEWPTLVAVGLALFTGQFLLQFLGIQSGVPPGLASVLVQTQAFFTVAFAALAFGERPRPEHLAGLGLAAVGVALIALTTDADVRVGGLLLTLGSAVSWAVGNVLLKRVGPVAMPPLVAWLSLVPPLPAAAVSLLVEGPGSVSAVSQASWASVGAAVYLGAVATVAAYAWWGALLRAYPAGLVAPFALLVPPIAALSSWLVLGERFGSLRLGGMACVLGGVVVAVAPWPRLSRRR